MIKKFRKCIAIFFFALLLPACQATPGAQIVQDKTNDLLALAQNASNNHYNRSEVEDRRTEVLVSNAGNVIVNIDAKVNIPSVDDIPVMRIEQGGFTQEILESIVDCFSEGNNLYINTGWTKEDLELLIANKKMNASIAENNGEDISSYESIIEYYKQLHNTAPSREDDEPFVFDSMENCDDINLKAYLGKDIPAAFSVDNRTPMLYFANNNSFELYYETALYDENNMICTGMNLTLVQAQQIAEHAVNEIAPSQMALVHSGKAYNIGAGISPGDIDEDLNQCFVFYFTRIYNGVCTTYANKASRILSDGEGVPAYSKSIITENITVMVNDSGVIRFSWGYIPEIMETVTESASMLSFSEIMDIFKNQIMYESGWVSENMITSRTIYITEIELGMMTIDEKDSPDSQLVVPVWDFIGKSVVQYYDETMETPKYHEIRESFLTINAIDGSIIDRSIGY